MTFWPEAGDMHTNNNRPPAESCVQRTTKYDIIIGCQDDSDHRAVLCKQRKLKGGYGFQQRTYFPLSDENKHSSTQTNYHIRSLPLTFEWALWDRKVKEIV
jgi:hypothetical protein